MFFIIIMTKTTIYGLSMEKLSAFITTYNNEATLAICLDSIKWADEIVVLDSNSTDNTAAIAQQYGCKVFFHPFLGYGKQKQKALQHTTHKWVLLLDADEALSPELQLEIQNLLNSGPDADGYDMPRQEQSFWKMCSLSVRLNCFLRLFDKTVGHISDMPIHASPKVSGNVKRLKHPFYHFGEVDIHTKVDKVNSYSSGLVKDKVAKGRRHVSWIMVFYPPFFFIRSYLFKRNFLNGWAGFITSVVGAFYVFLKYAKLYEHYQDRSKLPVDVRRVDRGPQ